MKHPYKLYNNSSVLLPDIGLAGLPKEIECEGHKLFIKDEFHITLLTAQYLAEVVQFDNPKPAKQQILEEFERFTETTPLNHYKISNKLRFAQADGKKTIIIMAEVLNLDKLFESLSQKFSIELPRQQTHVTLYRSPKDFIGIPIPSREALESISKPIDLPELDFSAENRMTC